MNNSFNEAYIGTNSGQLKDNSFSPNNTINKTIKLDTSNSNSFYASKYKWGKRFSSSRKKWGNKD